MKLKNASIVALSLFLGLVTSQAATMVVSNVVAGPALDLYPGDTLYAYNNNDLLDEGIVSIGYFVDGITEDEIDTLEELQAVLSTPGNYITVSTAVPGAVGSGISNGYADSPGVFVNTDLLIGRTVYSIVTNQLSLADFASGSGVGNQVALINVGQIESDSPFPITYSANPQAPATIVIGSLGAVEITDDSNPFGNGDYVTLQLVAVPEPSSALLCTLGALALLRRKR